MEQHGALVPVLCTLLGIAILKLFCGSLNLAKATVWFFFGCCEDDGYFIRYFGFLVTATMTFAVFW